MKILTVLAPLGSAIVASTTVVAQSVLEDGVGSDTITAGGLIGVGLGLAAAFWRREERRQARQVRQARRSDARNRKMIAALLEELGRQNVPPPDEYMRLLAEDDPEPDQ